MYTPVQAFFCVISQRYIGLLTWNNMSKTYNNKIFFEITYRVLFHVPEVFTWKHIWVIDISILCVRHKKGMYAPSLQLKPEIFQR